MRRAVAIALLALAAAAPASADPPPPGVETTAGTSSTAGAAKGLAAEGRALYGANCASCHETGLGPSLRGAGARAADFYLRTGYMPLRSPSAQPSRSRVLFSEHELLAMIAYVGSLGGPPIPKPHPERGNLANGRRLFTQHCAGCHQVVAEGGYVTGARVPPLEDATPVQVAEAVRIGPYLMPRFSARAISARQLDDIVAYVQYAKTPDDRGGWPLGHIGPVPEGMATWALAAVFLVALCVVLGRRLKA